MPYEANLPHLGHVINAAKTAQLAKIGEVCQSTTLSPASIYRLVKSGAFPKPVKLSARASAWRVWEVDAWIAGRESTINVVVGGQP